MFKDQESERLIAALNRLIADKSGMGEKINWSIIATQLKKEPQLFTDIKGGKQAAGLPLIKLVCEKYGINQDFILNGSGPIFEKDKSKNINTMERRIIELEKKYEKLEGKYETLMDIVIGKLSKEA